MWTEVWMNFYANGKPFAGLPINAFTCYVHEGFVYQIDSSAVECIHIDLGHFGYNILSFL